MEEQAADYDRAIAIILAGGVGSRLQPLTDHRTKPAVPFGGKFRIIDFTLSNCLHSRLRRILVLTQYKSHSLQKHLRDGWSIFNPTLGEYITPIPPQMRTGRSWYEGTADAVYQNLYLIERSGADIVVILSGDHVYRMDYSAMLRAHGETSADVTVASMRVALGEAGRFGILSIDEANRITRFEEKPVRPKPMPGDREHALASMGIYVFSREFLSEVLREDHEIEGSTHDFGNDILPRLISSCRFYAYLFGGHTGRVAIDRYWRDVGDLDAYHAANMDLLEPVPAMNIYQVDWPIRTFQIPSPPARSVMGRSGVSAQLINSMVSSGSIVAGACIRHSILSPNVRVNDGAVVENAILFEGVRVGEGARLSNCIVEKQVKVPPGESIGLDRRSDCERFTVSPGGIVVVPGSYRFTP